MAEDYIILIREPVLAEVATGPIEAEQARVHAAHGAFFAAIAAAGAEFVDGAGLQPPGAAVRITPARDGKPAVFTDGPFGETKEVISGYYKIRTKDAAAARELAALCPTADVVDLFPVLDTGV